MGLWSARPDCGSQQTKLVTWSRKEQFLPDRRNCFWTGFGKCHHTIQILPTPGEGQFHSSENQELFQIRNHSVTLLGDPSEMKHKSEEYDLKKNMASSAEGVSGGHFFGQICWPFPREPKLGQKKSNSAKTNQSPLPPGGGCPVTKWLYAPHLCRISPPRGAISFRNALPTWAMPNGIWPPFWEKQNDIFLA